MIFGIANILVKIFGLNFDKATRIARFVFVGLIVVVVLIPAFFIYRACNKPPKIDLEKIEKINKANGVERKKELRAVIEDNQDVIRTVDNRSAITEVNVVERNREIDAKVAEADRKITEAKSQGRDVTGPELECILIPENCP